MTSDAINPSVPITKEMLNDLDSVLASVLRLSRPSLGAVAQAVEEQRRVIRTLRDEAIEKGRQAAGRGAELGTPPGTEHGDPEIRLTRSVTRSITQTLVVHASEIGYLDYGLMAQGHALLEQLGALDANTRGVIERIEERVFFSPEFEDRIVEETNILTIDDTTNIEIKD